MRVLLLPTLAQNPTLGEIIAFLDALKIELEAASQDNDFGVLAEQYTLTGALTETRDLDVGAPNLTNVVRVLGTLLSDTKQGGSTLRSS